MNAQQMREVVEGLKGKVSPERLEWIVGRMNMGTTPHDSRFPTFNQMNHCWTRYNEWVLCLKETEGDEDACFQRKKLAWSICPGHWLEKWEEGRADGCFPGVQYSGEE